MRCFALLFFLLMPIFGANIRLYLKDGSHHIVREYSTVEDRVRFYSVERGDWEEIPLELVDLKRTEGDRKTRQESTRKDAEMQDAEEKADRAAANEIARVPYDPGAYLVAGAELKSLKQAECKVVNNRRRSILKAISPIPMVSGKSTVELEGVRSAITVDHDRPEFYFRLAAEERFGIARLTPTKAGRIVQKWDLIPVTKEIVEQTEAIDVFRRQVAEGLYKVWPVQPLAPGEYAVYEYTEGKGNIQVWDFSVQPKQ